LLLVRASLALGDDLLPFLLLLRFGEEDGEDPWLLDVERSFSAAAMRASSTTTSRGGAASGRVKLTATTCGGGGGTCISRHVLGRKTSAVKKKE